MDVILDHLKIVFRKPFYVILFLIVLLLLGAFFVYFINYELMVGNLGLFYANTEIVLSVLITLLFALFVSVQTYKIKYFNSFNKKEGSTSVLGTFFGVLVGGCAACSITFASYVGLAGVITLLPYHGIELKILGLLLLIYANYSLLKSLNTCSLKKAKGKNL